MEGEYELLYNVRIKTYPDGHKQYFWSEEKIFRLDEDLDPPELIENVKRKRHFSKLRREIQSFDRVDDIVDDVGEFSNNRMRSCCSCGFYSCYDHDPHV